LDLASKLKQTIPLTTYIQASFTGKQKGTYFNPCPFCDHDNCFSVSKEKLHLFSCFSCKVGGTVIDLYKHKHQVEDGPAIYGLAKEYKITVGSGDDSDDDSDDDNSNSDDNSDDDRKESKRIAFWIYDQVSTALTETQASAYLKGRGIGTLGVESMRAAGLRWNQYKGNPQILAPALCPSVLANGTGISEATFNSLQKLPIEGQGVKLNHKGGQMKGSILPFLHDNDSPVILVESVANAICLHTIGVSSICFYSSTFVDAAVSEIQKYMPERELLLWLDKGTEDKQVEACNKYKLPGLWFKEDATYGCDVNDLYKEAAGASDSSSFKAQVDEMIALAGADCPYEMPEPVAPATKGTVREEEKPQSNRIRIPLVEGDLHTILDSIETHITDLDYIRKVSNTASLFQRHESICRIIAREESVQGLVKTDESLALLNIDSKFLREYLNRIFNFEKWNNRARCFLSVNCPKEIAEHYMSRNCWRLPHLAGIIEAPTVLPSGQILQVQGYNKASGLYVHLPNDFEPIDEIPTKEDAVAAIDTFKKLFKDFPFEDGIGGPSFSVVVAAIITGLVRRSVRTAPLFCFTAPKMGSGKTLLADLIAIIATGRLATKETQAKDPAEQDKRMLATLVKGDQVICIDNIERPLEGDSFCTVLSETTWQSRILGETKQINIDTCSTWLATGNNLRLKGDLTTRAILCSLDPKCENPHERRFKGDIRCHVIENRTQYITAALTILRAYYVAGKPEQDIFQFGRFEEWSDSIRSALIWAGAKDPNDSIKIIMESDPTRETLVNLLSSWYGCFQSEPVTVRYIKHYLADNEYTSDDKIESLKEAICALSQGGRLDFNRLGYYLRKRKDRIESGYQLVSGKKNKGNLQWLVIQPFEISVFKISQARDLLKEKTEKEVAAILGIKKEQHVAFFEKVFMPSSEKGIV
jgi:hypothetical protein